MVHKPNQTDKTHVLRSYIRRVVMQQHSHSRIYVLIGEALSFLYSASTAFVVYVSTTRKLLFVYTSASYNLDHFVLTTSAHVNYLIIIGHPAWHIANF